jgi:pSer/pThr/pTyr-binding forkhead associated (FHA) protein
MSARILLTLRVLAALSLYAFLGLIIFTLWKDLINTDKTIAGNLQTPITIRDISKDETRDFRDNEIFVGRDERAQIRFQHDEAVSNMHARLFYKENNWWVEDLQSTNGTFLNQDPINTPTIIISGDQITCGKTTIEITMENDLLLAEI